MHAQTTKLLPKQKIFGMVINEKCHMKQNYAIILNFVYHMSWYYDSSSACLNPEVYLLGDHSVALRVQHSWGNELCQIMYVTYTTIHSHVFNFKVKSVQTVLSGVDWGFISLLVLINVPSFINLISPSVAVHFPHFNNLTNFVWSSIVFFLK